MTSLYEQLEARITELEQQVSSLIDPTGRSMKPQPEPALDPYASLKAAHAAGKVIEYNASDSDPEWYDCPNPKWNPGSEHRYRIKPDTPAAEAQGKSAEQKACELLDRIGVEDAMSFSAGDVVELANLIADEARLRRQLEEAANKALAVAQKYDRLADQNIWLRGRFEEAQSGRQYWMREALSRDTDGDDRDVEMRRLQSEKAQAERRRDAILRQVRRMREGK